MENMLLILYNEDGISAKSDMERQITLYGIKREGKRVRVYHMGFYKCGIKSGNKEKKILIS